MTLDLCRDLYSLFGNVVIIRDICSLMIYIFSIVLTGYFMLLWFESHTGYVFLPEIEVDYAFVVILES